MSNKKYGYGFKFLTPYGSTIYQGKEFFYNLPRNDQKWSDRTEHPNPESPDGKDCGSGRIHLMLKLSSDYAPNNWWVWFARYDLDEDYISGSVEKVGVKGCQLRRIPKDVFWKIIKFGYCSGADLSKADLSKADLSEADLSEARTNEYTILPKGYNHEA